MSTKLDIIIAIFGNAHKSSQNEHLFHCPNCNHDKPKLSINIAKNVYKCWTCSLKGPNLFQLIQKYGNSSQILQWRAISSESLDHANNIVDLLAYFDDNKNNDKCEEIINLPKEFISLVTNRNDDNSREARQFLKKRGITKSDIFLYKIGYAVEGIYKNRIIFPSFNKNGQVNYFVARNYWDDWRKYMNPVASKDIIFNELCIDFSQPITIVEGVFDAIKAGFNSVPILGSSLSETSPLFQQIVKNRTIVYMALDPDAKIKEDKIIKNLLQYGVEVHKIEIKGYKDIGEMQHEQFLQFKQMATLKTFDTSSLKLRLEGM